MTDKKKHIHRGAVVNTIVRGSNVAIRKIMKQMGYSRGTYYKHIQKADLDFSIVLKYGHALQHDFRNEFPDMIPYLNGDSTVEEPPPVYTPPTLEQVVLERDSWKDKYYELMERHQALMEKVQAKLLDL